MNDDEYMLRAESSSVNLAQHVNHQVEVTGRVGSSSGSTSGTTGTGTTGTGTTGTGTTGTGTTGTGTTGTGTTSSSRSSSSDHPTLTVTSIKMISAECK
jgi:hypothetical protein